MAEEPTETPTDTPVAETPPSETPASAAHPLEAGGVRFEEVVKQKNEARDQADFWKRQYETIAAKPPPTAPTPTPKRYYTAQEVDQAVTAGQISIGQAADLLASQRVEQGREVYRREAQQERILSEAQAEVSQYLERLPVLGRTDSAEFVRVARTAHEIAAELGLAVQDARVQRRACRETFGSLDRLKATAAVREGARRESDTHVEAGVGAGSTPAHVGKDEEKLRDIPPALKAHWDKMRYDTKKRLDELPYVDVARWKRLA